MSEVQYSFYSFFLFIPSTSSLAASSKHWHACQLEKCHPIPFLAGPMVEQMACGCQALPLQCIYCHAPPWWQKKAISEPIHSPGRGLEMCLEFVYEKITELSDLRDDTRHPKRQPSSTAHHRWHHLLAWLMLNSTAEAHRRWGPIYYTVPLLAVDLSGAIILIVSEAVVMNNWWKKQRMNTTSELGIKKKEGNGVSITGTASHLGLPWH